MPLSIKPKEQCAWDEVSLGEVMLRLDPGNRRIWTARTFHAYEGGGEYNVARGLKRCFGLSTAVVTAFADNPVGRLLEDLIFQGGVDQSLVRWMPYDGVGRTVRNGLNFTERGFGVRPALGCSDRGHTAVSQLKPGDIVVQLANRAGKLVMAGALTPTEVITAWKAGSDLVKVFPCGTVGGAKYIKALKAPLPHIPMVPTGGVNLTTASEFIQAGAAAFGVGGEFVSAAALQSGNTNEIVVAARKFVSIVRETREQMLNS